MNLEQGSNEWLEWRQKGIGASDAPSIMGESTRKSADELLRQKRGPAIDYGLNAATARGLILEPEAREHYILKTGIKMEPACLQSVQYPWLRASVDGLSTCGDYVVEIKCGKSIYAETSQIRRVPGHYYSQLQHILAVTGLDAIDFWCYQPKREGILLHIDRNAQYIEELLQVELRFLQLMLEKAK